MTLKLDPTYFPPTILVNGKIRCRLVTNNVTLQETLIVPVFRLKYFFVFISLTFQFSICSSCKVQNKIITLSKSVKMIQKNFFNTINTISIIKLFLLTTIKIFSITRYSASHLSITEFGGYYNKQFLELLRHQIWKKLPWRILKSS